MLIGRFGTLIVICAMPGGLAATAQTTAVVP